MAKSTVELVTSLIGQLKHLTARSQDFRTRLKSDDLIFSVQLSYLQLRFTIKQSDLLYVQYTIQEGGGALPGTTITPGTSAKLSSTLNRLYWNRSTT